jgi:tetratricopeptide (TPR) repeat protein
VAARAEDIPIGALRDWAFYNDVGWRNLKKGNYAKAEESFNLAIHTIRSYQGDQRLLARSYADLARVLYHERRYTEAEPLAKWALTVREAHSRVKPASVFQSLYVLALIHRAEHHYGESELLMRRALVLQEKGVGPDDANIALTLDQLAEICREQGKYREAEPLYQRAMSIHEQRSPDENLDLAESAGHYASFLRQTNRPDEAQDLEARASTIRDTVATKAARARARGADVEFRGFR